MIDNKSPMIYFGGAYSLGYSNPVLNNRQDNCPAGYTRSQALFTQDTDNEFFYCWYKQGDPNPPTSYFAFGGMYGYAESTSYVNPATGGQTCPDGYKASQVFGTTNVDHNIFMCWKEMDPINSAPGPLDQAISFGGMYGLGYVTATQTRVYANPLVTDTNTKCPGAYREAQMLGTDNRDWPLWLCYKLQTDFIIK